MDQPSHAPEVVLRPWAKDISYLGLVDILLVLIFWLEVIIVKKYFVFYTDWKCAKGVPLRTCWGSWAS